MLQLHTTDAESRKSSENQYLSTKIAFLYLLGNAEKTAIAELSKSNNMTQPQLLSSQTAFSVCTAAGMKATVNLMQAIHIVQFQKYFLTNSI